MGNDIRGDTAWLPAVCISSCISFSFSFSCFCRVRRAFLTVRCAGSLFLTRFEGLGERSRSGDGEAFLLENKSLAVATFGVGVGSLHTFGSGFEPSLLFSYEGCGASTVNR